MAHYRQTLTRYRQPLASGELPRSGMNVRHYVDNDTGRILKDEVRPHRRGYEHIVTVRWSDGGVQDHYPDELFRHHGVTR